MNILLDNSVKVLWALYERIHLQTYRAPIGAVFVPCLRIQLPGSSNRMYGADDRYIKLSSSCMRRYGAYEPRHETNGCLHMRNKDADQLRGNREANQRLCFRYTESTIPLLPKSEISSYWPTSVTVQPVLCLTWSETPKTGFLTTRLI